MTMEPWDELLADAERAALRAWEAISPYWRSSGLESFVKADDSPVTVADRMADKLIVESLQERYPASEYGYLTEEFEHGLERLERRRVWIIDPIDGTRDFMRGGSQFAIQVGVAERLEDGHYRPVAAVVYQPITGDVFFAARGGGAFVRREADLTNGAAMWWQEGGRGLAGASWDAPKALRASRKADLSALTAVITSSRPPERLKRALDKIAVKDVFQSGSMGVKVAMVASDRADFYMNLEPNRCKEWDICAPQLILEEAGGRVSDAFGRELTYNLESPAKTNGVVASNRVSHEAILSAIADLEDLPR
ncbi:MAG: 3'(2'),5'-bisphosphate nucleotidase CysQ [Sumerlaeia bacterium]